ncbi:response regulator transcription factor [Bacillus aquiflavi]|uniref:Heme response regulator HssR n=1 Tax=Bacillus aquiflavi TaxID=2672567 RepID=A0A6B3VXA2_9BACI|nr:response regulator transcription factor [Bacillus aquiflavi]MBA4536538.1 response regulator transcription factor [Bacillus aquiflavi]NEY80905.1 response regulator transcription factor [Bacillus aquiflavi]UAC49625.1 response regulator transcription factor [Bacillus aquiflavi]
MRKILVADDDINIRNIVKVYLNEEGYRVLEAENGFKALEILENETCDLAIVDIMMPIVDGFELTKEIRTNYNIPIILLTAKTQIEDKEKGFLSGTDDYLVKPFEPKELLFRIKALLRRYDKPNEVIIQLGSTKINKKSYEVHIGHQAFLLPLKEFELLYFLASHPNQVLSRDQLIEAIWGVDYKGDERTVDVHIKRLRDRFSALTDDFRIKTKRGVGYFLEEKQK